MGTENPIKYFKASAVLLAVFFMFYFYTPLSAAEGQPSVKEMFASGHKALEEQRYQDAINFFEAVIETNNGFAAAYHALGMDYQEISTDPRYPLWYFETAVEIDPDFSPSYDVLCRSYYQLQEYYEAEDICLKALELNPNLRSSQLSLAWVYLIGYSNPDKALYYFEEIVEYIKAPAIYFGLGMAYAMRGEHAKVLDAITYLRSQGAEDFAIHLEVLLRSKTDPEKLIPPGFLKARAEQEEQAQELQRQAAAREAAEKSGITRVPVPVPVAVKPQITGTPQIHIKGKIRPPRITGMSGYSEPVKRGGQSGRHPGGFTQD